NSTDVTVSRNYLMAGNADLILNVLDASNLERHLYLTTQLLELGLPMVVALNMMDVAEDRGRKIDLAALENLLGCPVIPLVASRDEGVEPLKTGLLNALKVSKQPTLEVDYHQPMSGVLDQICAQLQQAEIRFPVCYRYLAVSVLSGDLNVDDGIPADIVHFAQQEVAGIETASAEDLDILIADARYSLAHHLTGIVTQQQGEVKSLVSDRIDSWVLNRYLSVPLFIFVMYLMFTFTINIGGAFIDVFDQLAQTIFVDGFGTLLSAMGSPDWLRVLLADGVGGGIQVVATFIPIIGFLYLALAFLEDSGYMSRVAFIMDRFMGRLGLPGKAFVPLIVGFGCNVPAIMSARTLEDPRERVMTVMMSPFMSCGARLSVYALFAAAFFADGGQVIVLLLYLIGIAAAILTAVLLKYTLLPGESEPLIIELPSYHLPTVKGILMRTWHRLHGFLRDAGKLIVLMVLLINFLNSIGTDGSFGNQDSEHSVLSAMSRAVTPVFEPFGIHEDNWPATVGIFTGVMAKEVVVGSLNALYSQMGSEPAEMAAEPEAFDFWGGIGSALATVPENFSSLTQLLTDPLGLALVKEDQAVAAAEQDVDMATFGAMASRFDGAIGAFAYLIFILMYFPCVAATSAIMRETNALWTLFAVSWSTLLAYVSATLFYQLATLPQHPASSLWWVTAMLALIAGVFLSLRYYADRQQNKVVVA
ncbi:MAG: Fe(2+) transporter permease subunit FeoB, partial [Gammaproteobacteria bacterium]|nr:Fe(2+) transporter permease subunit FeoB [Gammaproteobacteria bacterium]